MNNYQKFNKNKEFVNGIYLHRTKSYVKDGQYSYEYKPIAASDDYKTMVDYVNGLINYILEYGDDWLHEYQLEDLVVWRGYNYYTVGSKDRKTRIIFRIQDVPKLLTLKVMENAG